MLQPLFPTVELDSHASASPGPYGESLAELHKRCASAIASIISAADAGSDSQPESLLLCTHAAVVIALGRVLTGRRCSEDWAAGDFDAFTCGVSKFVRRGCAAGDAEVDEWVCEINSGVEHLAGGGERNW